MASDGAVTGLIQTLYDGGSVCGFSDAQLIERCRMGDEARSAVAFSAIVARHGPMVLRVCRATLRHEHDAADAFQGVFLVLYQKAGTLWVRDSLGPWLHSVALRICGNLRLRATRIQKRENAFGSNRCEFVDHAEDQSEVAAVIHEEVGRLPQRYREAVVLCDLEGLSHEMAASQLGWPIGTLKSRQARGRERLRGQLTRRGFAPIEAVSGLMLLPPPPLSPAFTNSTVRAAVAFSSTESTVVAGAVSATSVTLARHLLRSMMLKSIKLSFFSILAATTLVAGVVFVVEKSVQGQAQAIPPGRKSSAKPAVRPAAGSVLELRIAADSKHNPDAKAGQGFRYVKVDPRGKAPLGGLITRKNAAGTTELLVKLDPQNLTERDLVHVEKSVEEMGNMSITFRFSKDAGERFAAITKAHLPEENTGFRYQMALIVRGQVAMLPAILSEISGGSARIEFNNEIPSAEIEEAITLLKAAAALNVPPIKAKDVKDQAGAIREAMMIDVPALAEANKVEIEVAATGVLSTYAGVSAVSNFRQSLHPREVSPSGGIKAATLSFLHDDELIRKIWVYEGGEWGFERPGVSWTTGADPELWTLIKARISR